MDYAVSDEKSERAGEEVFMGQVTAGVSVASLCVVAAAESITQPNPPGPDLKIPAPEPARDGPEESVDHSHF